MCKVINKLGPDYLAPLCTPASKVHDHNTRAAASAILHLPRTVTNIDRKAFSFCTYPKWSLVHLREVRIPKPDNRAWSSLRVAFDQVQDCELRPMREASQCEARKVIDHAAAQALNLPPDRLRDWRERLSKEPTVNHTIPE